MSDESAAYGRNDEIGAHLTETDQDVLRAWYDNLVLLDRRYHDKRVRMIGARAMTDDEFRDRLTRETETAAAENEPGSRERFRVQFHANTPMTLHIVLPPKAGSAESLPAPLREVLRSRTSNSVGFFQDDWNISDRHTRDHQPADGADGIDGTHPVDGTDTWDSTIAVA